MKKAAILFLLIFTLFITVSYAVLDADQDGVPDCDGGNQNACDKCPSSQTTVVDQFGCNCEQKTSSNCASSYSGAQCCVSDNNPCTDDCGVVSGLAACNLINNNNQCPGGVCRFGVCTQAVQQTQPSTETRSIQNNNNPIGWIDGITQDRIISGWALDKDHLSDSIDVHIYFDGPASSGTLIAGVNANLFRPDVNQAEGVTGNHGYNFRIPDNYRDGREHSVWVYGIDRDDPSGNSNRQLLGVPKNFRFGMLNNNLPIGWIDNVNCEFVRGWVLDQDTPNQPMQVYVYADGPAGSGTFIGTLTTEVIRADVNNFYGVVGNHGFIKHISSLANVVDFQLRDSQVHTLYFYGIDTLPSNNRELDGSPKTIRCTGDNELISQTRFFAEPSTTINAGEEVTLSWVTASANSVKIEDLSHNLLPNVQDAAGNIKVRPTISTTYIFTATYPSSDVTKSVTVNVQGVPSPISPPDITYPSLINGQPSGSLPAETTSTTLSLSTDRAATCRYSTTAGISYSSMTNNFVSTTSNQHSTTISGLANGNTYYYYVKCQDTTGRANTDDYVISFTVGTRSIRFAVIGDYGAARRDGPDAERDVANLVAGWNPDVIITTADNCYPNCQDFSTIDEDIGQFYHSFIYPYKGNYGAGATANKFFPSIGNHDWNWINPSTPSLDVYSNYFTLPGNGRYYDFAEGPVHFFALNVDYRELFRDPDGITSDSIQGNWLRNGLANAPEPWKVVYFHFPPYTSGNWMPQDFHAYMRWPFKEWGASVVFTGHTHFYERLNINGFPYIINGLGGATDLDELDPPTTGSMVRYTGDFGAQLADATDTTMTIKFITRSGITIDTLSLQYPCPPRCGVSNDIIRMTTFTADKTSITAGEEVLLSWVTWDASAVRILDHANNPLPNVQSSAGYVRVRPQVSTTYIFTASYPSGDVTKSVNVNVQGANFPYTGPPLLSNGLPSGTLPRGTTPTTLSLNTDRLATCRYSTTAGVSYSSMANTFTTTGGRIHSTTVAGLSNGFTYNYYVRCQDNHRRGSNDDYIIGFTVI